MKKLLVAAMVLVLAMAGVAQAVPVLQVGAPAGPGDAGIYADYAGSLTNPTETDTAVTSGNTILVAGEYAKDVVNLGAAVAGGLDWSALGGPAIFDGYGAVLLVSVANGSGQTAYDSLMVNGNHAFGWDPTSSYFPNFHDPVKAATSDFVFFSIGDFDKSLSNVPNLVTETPGPNAGQIKLLTIGGMGDLAWIHFDIMAIETIQTESGGKNSQIVTTYDLEANPGSKDVTWKVPEPSTLLLLGFGLAGMGLYRRMKG